MLVDPRDAEEREDHGDDEHVVHRQGLFHREARQVLRAGARPQGPPDEAAEGEPEPDVDGGQHKALAHRDLPLLLVQQAEVDDEKGDDDGEEGKPHPGGLAEKRAEQHEIEGGHGALRLRSTVADIASRGCQRARLSLFGAQDFRFQGPTSSKCDAPPAIPPSCRAV